MNTWGDIEATLPEQPEPESHLVKIIAVELCSVEELQLVVDLRFKMVVEAEVLKRVDQLHYLDRVNCGGDHGSDLFLHLGRPFHEPFFGHLHVYMYITIVEHADYFFKKNEK